MIGQKKNLEKIKNIGFTPLIVIIGPDMMGKYTLAREACNLIDPSLKVFEIDKGIDNLREGILNNKDSEKSFFIIENFERFSTQAQNAMLKTFEDSKDRCFIITVENPSTLLETIKTRGKIIMMESYTKEEIGNDYLRSPSEVEYWKNKKLEEYIEQVKTFYNTFINKSIIYSINELNKLVGFKLEDDKPYFIFFLRFFNSLLDREFNWKKPNLAIDYIRLRNKLNAQLYSLSIIKENALSLYFRSLKDLINDNI